MKIGFTGTQLGMNPFQAGAVGDELRSLTRGVVGEMEFHHGVCVGADEQAHYIADEAGFWLVGHPPEDESKMAKGLFFNELREPFPYLIRNEHIAYECDLLIATPKGPPMIRSGTWSCVRRADGFGKKIVIFYPNGEKGVRNAY